MPRSASQHGSQMGRFDDLDLSRQRAHVVGHGSVARMSGAHAHTHSARVLSMKRSNGDGWTIVAVWLRSVLDWLRVVTTASPRIAGQSRRSISWRITKHHERYQSAAHCRAQKRSATVRTTTSRD